MEIFRHNRRNYPTKKETQKHNIGEIEGRGKIVHPETVNKRPGRPEVETELGGEKKNQKTKEQILEARENRHKPIVLRNP